MSVLPILPRGLVVGRILTSRGDSADADRHPDTAVVVGLVDFTPATAYRKLDAATVVTHSKITAKLDSHGDLHPQRETSDTTGSDAEDGIWLPTGTWKVTYRLNTGFGSLPEHNITVTAAHTEAAPLPLFADLGDPAPAGATFVQLSAPLGGQQGQVLVMNDGSLAWGDVSGGTGMTIEGVRDVVGAMVAAAGGSYNDAAGTITLPPGGGSSTITADDTPAAPAEGASASYLVTSAVAWPAGLVWSTDPDGGAAPTITGSALVSLFTVGGTTRAIMGATFPGVVVPDTANPTAGTLASSAITDTGFTLTVSGAADGGGLHSQPYAFDDGSGTFGAWQTPPSLVVTGKTAETAYTCRHKVRDAEGNETTGAGITVTTLAVPVPSVGLADAILALSPVGYWKLDETSGTQATDYSGNNRHGIYSGAYALAGQDGFAKNGKVTVADSPVFELNNSGTGMTVFALWRTTWAGGEHRFIRKYGSGYEWAVQSTKAIGVRVWGSTSDDLMGENGPQNLEPHTWSAVAAAFPNPSAGARVPLYRNSGTALTATQPVTYSGSYAGTTSPLTLIGDDADIALGHVAIFPTQLTGAQVGALVDAARAEGFIA